VTNDKQNLDQNDQNSIHDAFMEHRSILMAYLARFLIRREDVEDIMQETYVSTVEASSKRPINSPRSYLFIVARNLIYKQLRSQSKQRLLDISEIDESHMISPDTPADEKVFRKAQMEIFLEAVNSLPAQCRRVFLMRKMKGMAHRDIAKELRISTSTVERHITNALTRCQEIMSKKGYEIATDQSIDPPLRSKAESDE